MAVKIKGSGHVRTTAYPEASHAFGPGLTLAVYRAFVEGKVSGTSGPCVVLGSKALLDKDRGIHLSIGMAKVLPAMLRSSAVVAVTRSDDVAIIHTVEEEWAPWRIFTPPGAIDMAAAIEKALLGH